ncbi:MAG: serine/threonine-protein phosphatase [Actinobacteria bacterium]|nr:serine/threonine-protein phosphatase [Actinomycetota bacterium]
MATHPWERTALGAPDTWPESLRVSVSLCLSSNFPILVAWGPDLLMIYNEGYREMLGRDKHPAAVGRPVQDVWPEVWPDIEPLFEHVHATGLAYNAANLPLNVLRNGYLEEVFFTFCYSPIRDGDEVGGTLDVSIETTAEVVTDRRLTLVGHLAASVMAAQNVAEVAASAVAALGTSEPDLEWAQVHLWVDDHLVPLAAGGPRSASPIADGVLQAVSGPDAVVLDDRWVPGAPARRVAVGVGSGGAAAVLVLGLNPLRPFDAGHRTFVELVGRTVGAALENAYRRSFELGQQRLISDTLQAAMLAPASDLPTVAARYRPATGHLAVGGDWYDVISLPDGRRALVVGDCVGHGLDAATAMGQLRSASRALLLEGRSPAEVITSMDHFADSVPGGALATMACAVIDLEGGTATYACAGHPPPLLVRQGEGIWLDDGRSGPLGFRSSDRGQAEATIVPGDLLVFYSDGLVERRDEVIDDGLARLRAAAEAHAGEPVQAVADALIGELLEPRPWDDVVVLVKRVH